MTERTDEEVRRQMIIDVLNKKLSSELKEHKWLKVYVRVCESHVRSDEIRGQVSLSPNKNETLVENIVKALLSQKNTGLEFDIMYEDGDEWCKIHPETQSRDLCDDDDDDDDGDPKKKKNLKIAVRFEKPPVNFASSLILLGDAFRSFGKSGEKSIKLREPQEYALKQIRNVLKPALATEDKVPRFITILPTGCGKTMVMCLAPYMLDVNKVLIIAPDTTISDQLYKQLRDDYRIDGQIGRITGMNLFTEKYTLGNSDIDCESPVVIGHIGALSRISDAKLKCLKPDLLLVDEGHHAVADSWINLESRASKVNPQLKTILLTATPQRGDGRTYGLIRMNRNEDQFYYVYSRNDAARNRFIKTTQYHPVKVNEEPKSMKQSEEFYSSEEYLGKMLDKGVELLRNQRRACNDVPFRMLVTVKSKKAADAGTKFFNSRSKKKNWGLRAVAIYGPLANDKTKKDENSQSKELFSKSYGNDIIDVVFQCKMLGEGYDNQWISVSVFLFPPKSITKLAQTHGRALRKPPEKYVKNLHELGKCAHLVYPDWEGINNLVKEYQDGKDETIDSLFDRTNEISNSVSFAAFHRKLARMSTEEGVKLLRESFEEYHDYYMQHRSDWDVLPADEVAKMVFESRNGEREVNILDLGCGRDGLFESKLSQLVASKNTPNCRFNVLAVDIIELAENDFSINGRLVVESCAADYGSLMSDERFKTKEGSFDIVVFCLSMMMQDSLEHGLLVATKALKVNGDIFIVWNTSKFNGKQFVENKDLPAFNDCIDAWCKKLKDLCGGFDLREHKKVGNMVYLRLINTVDKNRVKDLEAKLSGITMKKLLPETDSNTDESMDLSN